MSKDYISRISSEQRLSLKSVRAVVELLDGGATVPFMARYRKEATGSLDEVAITRIRERIHQLRELDKRRETILASIDDQGKLSDELKEKILAAETLSVLEDIYLPYKPKRRTRATIAKEKGLEPLAALIFKQEGCDPQKEAENFINPGKKVETIQDALAGARDIIAEWVSENTEARAKLRDFFFAKGVFKSAVARNKESEAHNYKDYFKWQEPVKTAPSHRILASRRGEKEGLLTLKVEVPDEEALDILNKQFLKGAGPDSQHVESAIADAFKRLLNSAMETEVRLATKERADQEAINVFSKNLRDLLLAPPLGPRRIMAVDPGYRSGCKLVCLDAQGNVQYYDTIYITAGDEQLKHGKKILKDLCERYDVEYIAIGNGTACRETENFIRTIDFSHDVHVAIVSESGASIYSASEVARKEFPDYDVTVRGAISIGRRLMDPLAELVKIDPKSIGVGQYQYDVDQKLLKQSLDDVVVSCVNLVGVELNTASKELLTYVSGLGPTRAQKIIDCRQKQGPFKTRTQLYDVPGLGPKAVEQAAGFLRIRDGDNILDSSAVHPESYHIVESMAKDLNSRVYDLIKNGDVRKKIHLEKYVNERVGLPTLKDIYHELAKPGRDPRAEFEIFRFKEGVEKPEDLLPGMELPGVVTNITDFGAFVDIGVHLDGLVHISQLSDKYVKHPTEVVKMHQKVHVRVLEVDLTRKRIALTMKKA